MALGHNWLPTSIEVMHLHAYFAQAIQPGQSPLLQYPSIDPESLKQGSSLTDFLQDREQAKGLINASKHIGKLEIVDAQFKVIGERLVTPGAFVQLVFKLRLDSPLSDGVAANKLESEDKSAEEEKDKAFLISKGDTETLPGYKAQWAHAPHWPAVCLMICDREINLD
jgi:translocation protein SEC63